MCNLANERKRINELLILAVNSDVVRSRADATQLMEVSHAALREHYQDKCPDECIRKRCEEFAQSIALSRQRTAEMTVTDSQSGPRDFETRQSDRRS